MHHITSSCTSYMHVYLATRGYRCSPVGPHWAPDPPVKEREQLWETRTRTAKASLCGTPGPIVSSSDCPCSLGTRPTTHWKAGPATLPLLLTSQRSATSLLHAILHIWIGLCSRKESYKVLPCFTIPWATVNSAWEWGYRKSRTVGGWVSPQR